MDSRKITTSNSKKKRKKKPKPGSLPKLLEHSQEAGIESKALPEPSVTEPNTPVFPQIPEVTITPPQEEPNQYDEVYTPPETNILSNSVIKKKKKKKKPVAAPVVKDEVRPSAVLKYVPLSKRQAIAVQPTVNEIEEEPEELEELLENKPTPSPISKPVCSSENSPSKERNNKFPPILEIEVENKSVNPSENVINSVVTSFSNISPSDNSTSISEAETETSADNSSSIICNSNHCFDDSSAQNHKENSLEKTVPQNITEDVTSDIKMPEAKPPADQKTKAQLKAERKAAFEAQRSAQTVTQKNEAAQKSKAELRAERRAVQEAQRATKDPQKPDTSKKVAVTIPDQKKPEVAVSLKNSAVTTITTIEIAGPTLLIKQPTKIIQEKEATPQSMRLFSHLPKFEWNPKLTADLGLSGKSFHPALIQAGLRMAQGLIYGSDARCVATLFAFKEVIKDYSTPPQKELSRDLDAKVNVYVKFLNKCRPLSVSMTNCIKQLKWYITRIPSKMTDEQAKEKLCEEIDTFVKEEIILSKKAIAKFATSKIHSNDVILIYACSPLIKQVLCEAQAENKIFKVIVVDSRPGLDGQEMLRYLIGKKIECSYVLINAVSYVMKEVKLVLLDCHSLQANGYVMSRIGSSQIALVAQASNVPVLVCCETYKFCERVLTDAFVSNELGNPEDIVTSTPAHKSHLDNWRNIPFLNIVNMTYDVTPADLVTSVVTELGMLPCTSVPVVLRVKHLSIPEPTV